ncbi:MAG: hypothetical protein F3741_00265 [Nitrospinae bacterium]|nr:hypothetical protein [Nitrospinota bacterium]
MKKFLFVAVMAFLIQNVAYAEDMGNSDKVEERKGQIIEHINKKRGLLNEFESCVKSAGSRADLKNCRKQYKEKMDSMRSERKARKGR